MNEVWHEAGALHSRVTTCRLLVVNFCSDFFTLLNKLTEHHSWTPHVDSAPPRPLHARRGTPCHPLSLPSSALLQHVSTTQGYDMLVQSVLPPPKDATGVQPGEEEEIEPQVGIR
jgi:hypothetical protein